MVAYDSQEERMEAEEAKEAKEAKEGAPPVFFVSVHSRGF
jgi:hypothetical protein